MRSFILRSVSVFINVRFEYAHSNALASVLESHVIAHVCSTYLMIDWSGSRLGCSPRLKGATVETYGLGGHVGCVTEAKDEHTIARK